MQQMFYICTCGAVEYCASGNVTPNITRTVFVNTGSRNSIKVTTNLESIDLSPVFFLRLLHTSKKAYWHSPLDQLLLKCHKKHIGCNQTKGRSLILLLGSNWTANWIVSNISKFRPSCIFYPIVFRRTSWTFFCNKLRTMDRKKSLLQIKGAFFIRI